MIEKRLVEALRAQFALDWQGIHGAPHWSRARENGLKLAELTGAHAGVVELFAFIHDSRRLSDRGDPRHGARAGEFAKSLRAAGVISLSDSELDLLIRACAGHSDGRTVEDITVQVCWDADRLDLGRVGIVPQPRYLCTDAAKRRDVIEWAYGRSRARGADSLGP
jgi:uncharacterized protein